MADVIRKHLVFTGRVQGVGFRYKAMYLADQLGLTGFAENLWDGTVEMEVQGNSIQIQDLIERLGKDRFIRIDHVEESSIPCREGERRFGVR